MQKSHNIGSMKKKIVPMYKLTQQSVSKNKSCKIVKFLNLIDVIDQLRYDSIIFLY